MSKSLLTRDITRALTATDIIVSNTILGILALSFIYPNHDLVCDYCHPR